MNDVVGDEAHDGGNIQLGHKVFASLFSSPPRECVKVYYEFMLILFSNNEALLLCNRNGYISIEKVINDLKANQEESSTLFLSIMYLILISLKIV